MEKNQRVDLHRLLGGGFKVISRQARSTPGAYVKAVLKRATIYSIRATGWGDGDMRLWVGDYDRETLYYSGEGFKKEATVLEHDFDTGGRTHFHIGLLFNSPHIGATAIITSLEVTEKGQGRDKQEGRLKNDKEVGEEIRGNYDKYWRAILDIIETTPRDQLWVRIRDHEYRRTRKEKVFHNGSWVPFEGNWALLQEAFERSRAPILELSQKADVIMEIGAGWGKNLYYLREKLGRSAIGLELTEGGVEAMRRLGIDGRLFDLEDPHYPKVTGGTLLVFSAWTLKEVTWLKKMVFYKLLDCGADKIIGFHLEPVGWQLGGEGGSLGGKVYKHFNCNLVSILWELEQEGRLRITRLDPDAFGFFSPLNIGSALQWESL